MGAIIGRLPLPVNAPARKEVLLKNARQDRLVHHRVTRVPMFDAKRNGRILGHFCGVVGVAVGADTILDKFAQNYLRLFPYGLSGIVISLFMIALGARVVAENQRRNWKGPGRR
jgi:hypothetical protein